MSERPSPLPADSALVALVTARTGLLLSELQRRRLAAHAEPLREGRDDAALADVLARPEGARALAELVASVTVHRTELFRDPDQLAAFRDEVLVPLCRARRPLRLWSAGCSTGEEVATLLLLLEEVGAPEGSEVLGTDVSWPALQRARTLTFPAAALARVPEPARSRHFVPAPCGGATLAPLLAGRARFLLHNLADVASPAPPGGFDAILCRNVLIYFTPEAVERVLEGLGRALAPGGTLVLASTEPLLGVRHALQPVRSERAFFYRRG